ncbi:hypothetical protein CHARACLAT_027116 [Characodon lateralis]|uniref:Uncharacterized protein n=1 Tax=Characodon lateralis TaxID=208331 RepID=A0ABU7EPC9_9TELE|nr:hypothetical protein [Characodon lateralis]
MAWQQVQLLLVLIGTLLLVLVQGWERVNESQLIQFYETGWKNISVEDAPKYCDYHMNHLKNVLTVDFTGCNVREDIYSLQLSFRVSGRHQELTAFCVESTKFDPGLLPRTLDKHMRCDKLTNHQL